MSRITSGSDRLSPVGSVTTRSAATASRLILALMLAGELLVGWGADAQTPERIHRVGFIGVSPSSSAHPAAHLQPLRDALHQRGWIEGRISPWSSVSTKASANGSPSFGGVHQQPDEGHPYRDRSGDGSCRSGHAHIPIVILTGAEPVRLGVAESLARPGGNVTGTLNFTGPWRFAYLSIQATMRRPP